MNVRRLSEDGDIVFGYGNSTFKKDSVESVLNVLQYRFKLFIGEWMMDQDAGLDLQLGEMSKESVDSIIKSRILETEDVTSIIDFESNIDTKTRKYTAKVNISTTYGETDTEVTL